MMGDELANKFGACCACGGVRRVRNVVMLPLRGPAPGLGWGCMQCGLPCDGAVAFLCDRCVRRKRRPTVVSAGFGSRVSIESLDQTPFLHDLSRHPEAEPGDPG